MSDGSMLLRIKRKNQVYFVPCHEDDTIGYLKDQVSLATKNETEAKHMRIINPKDNLPLEDDGEQINKYSNLKNESELYVVFQIGEEDWEAVHIEDTESNNE